MPNVVGSRLLLPVAAALAIGLTGTAQAKAITGTPGSDRIHGSRQADVIDAQAGDDRIGAGRGADTVAAGDGSDRVGGGWGDDQLHGGPGNDTIYAGGGRDETWGEDGNDTLWALARKDVHAPNDTLGDTLHGGPGDDTFKTRDGEADVIDCGPGVDTALLDFKDVIADASAQNPNGSCEVVNRERRAKKGEDQRESADPTEDVSSN